MKYHKTVVDIITNKEVIINGVKTGGIQSITFDMDIRKNDIRNLVTLTLAIKRDSLRIFPPNSNGTQTISFDTI